MFYFHYFSLQTGRAMGHHTLLSGSRESFVHFRNSFQPPNLYIQRGCGVKQRAAGGCRKFVRGEKAGFETLNSRGTEFPRLMVDTAAVDIAVIRGVQAVPLGEEEFERTRRTRFQIFVRDRPAGAKTAPLLILSLRP
jgi:hypothetical protein